MNVGYSMSDKYEDLHSYTLFTQEIFTKMINVQNVW